MLSKNLESAFETFQDQSQKLVGKKFWDKKSFFLGAATQKSLDKINKKRERGVCLSPQEWENYLISMYT